MPEAATQRCSAKEMFLKISQENICVGVPFLMNLQAKESPTKDVFLLILRNF